MYTKPNGKQTTNLRSVQMALSAQMRQSQEVEYTYSIDLGVPTHVLEQWIINQGFEPHIKCTGNYIHVFARQLEDVA